MSANVLAGLEPQAVFGWFEKLCAIPHGSGNVTAIGDFCVQFARERGLRCRKDEIGNVVIWKDAAPGYEDHPAVIIQGHLDMVCEKDPDCDLDFKRDGLRLAVDGDRLYAKGTTLGGDDGFAVACALAVLDGESLRHPPLEVLLTADEEIGLLGATALDPSDLKGRVLLNLDSEEEGILTVSCAGGATAQITLPVKCATAEGTRYRLEVSGLEGGHSGSEIHKGGGNANKLLAEALAVLDCASPLRLAGLAGGSKDNAIPRAASARFISRAPDGLLQTLTANFEAGARERFPNEPGLAVTCAAEGEAAEGWDRESTVRALRLLRELPNGVQAMSRDIAGLVETSLNLGILRADGGTMELGLSVRSSLGQDKRFLLAALEDLSTRCGASYSVHGEYPAWEYRKDSPLRERMVEVFEAQYGRKPQVEAIHAGLECGILAGKLPGLDSVSFGPDMSGVHTSNETLSISSSARVWQYLCAVLERL